MMSIIAAISAESLKAFRSKVFLITILAFSIVPFMTGFYMLVLKNEADWPTFFGVLSRLINIGGVLGFGFIASWVYGREYSENTIKDLLALPVSRAWIVFAKWIIVVIWCTLILLIVIVLSLIIGKMINITGWSMEMVFQGIQTLVVTTFLTIMLCTPVTFFASYGRGYLLPMGVIIIVLMLSQVVGTLGYGQYFPWSIPALFNSLSGTEETKLGIVSYIILYGTTISGLIATFTWWQFADQK